MKKFPMSAVVCLVFCSPIFALDWMELYQKEKEEEIKTKKDFIITASLKIDNYSENGRQLIKSLSVQKISSLFTTVVNPTTKNFSGDKNFIDITADTARKLFEPNDKKDKKNFNNGLINLLKTNSLIQGFIATNPVASIISNVLSFVGSFNTMTGGKKPELQVSDQSAKIDQFVKELTPYIDFYDRLSVVNREWQDQLDVIGFDIEKNNEDFKSLSQSYSLITSRLRITKDSSVTFITNAYKFERFNIFSAETYSLFSSDKQIQDSYNILTAMTNRNKNTLLLIQRFDDLQLQYYKDWVGILTDFKEKSNIQVSGTYIANLTEIQNEIKNLETQIRANKPKPPTNTLITNQEIGEALEKYRERFQNSNIQPNR